MTVNCPSPGSPAATPPTWSIQLLYDGDCPLCLREVRFLKSRDRRGAIDFVDIASPHYDPLLHQNISYHDAMGRIHAILPSGEILRDVAVFRHLYQAVGLGWVYALTRLRGVETLANWVYGIWARRRLAWTGRPDLAELEAQRQCQTGRCSPPSA
ncbi:thiol-disulfide oxidoreductase DCC family protein [Lyngbya confervoides]|uniref:DUF393 domain-containing protein n=1 Tax=Lyngbya confervoides BDU141951 TaxID=1574623 RepID=A0ABD4T4F8_9CYAN|nr:DUF393 domain-containing protein [Lyngbya confervoides]MCM1983474.1 DUF393 domain-containing protein [Lyngbya confervoides BDU141951]